MMFVGHRMDEIFRIADRIAVLATATSSASSAPPISRATGRSG